MGPYARALNWTEQHVKMRNQSSKLTHSLVAHSLHIPHSQHPLNLVSHGHWRYSSPTMLLKSHDHPMFVQLQQSVQTVTHGPASWTGRSHWWWAQKVVLSVIKRSLFLNWRLQTCMNWKCLNQVKSQVTYSIVINKPWLGSKAQNTAHFRASKNHSTSWKSFAFSS